MKKIKNLRPTDIEVVECILLTHGFDVGTEERRGTKDNFSSFDRRN